LISTVTERPVASAWARSQALQTNHVTSLRHRTVSLDDVVARKFLTLLDGSRDQTQLLDAMNAFLAQSRPDDRTKALPKHITAEDIAMRLGDVARLALLSG
jgi:hypothetical protein